MGRSEPLEALARKDVEERFRFHPATPTTGPKHEEVRDLHKTLALWVMHNIPSSRERALALTALQESMMWANAAIAIHTQPEPLPVGKRDEA